jgi:hypothetical protein
MRPRTLGTTAAIASLLATWSAQVCAAPAAEAAPAPVAQAAPPPPPPPPPPPAAAPPAPAPAPARVDAPSAPAASAGDPHAGEMGIQVSLPAGGDPTFGFTYFVADSAAIRADLGLGITSASGATQTFSLELGVRYYFAKFDRFAPFIEPGIFLANQNVYGPANMDLGIEAALGGEFFVTDHFSFGGRTGGALNMNFAPNPANGQSTIVTFRTGTPSVFGQFLW